MSNLKILVAEDNEINAMVMKQQLNLLGYESKIVNNGLMALKELKLSVYDLIFMDTQMPVLDGFQATRRIRTSTIRNQPIIIASTYNHEKIKDNLISSGMDDYVNKPANNDELKTVISKWFKLLSR